VAAAQTANAPRRMWLRRAALKTLESGDGAAQRRVVFNIAELHHRGRGAGDGITPGAWRQLVVLISLFLCVAHGCLLLRRAMRADGIRAFAPGTVPRLLRTPPIVCLYIALRTMFCLSGGAWRHRAPFTQASYAPIGRCRAPSFRQKHAHALLTPVRDCFFITLRYRLALYFLSFSVFIACCRTPLRILSTHSATFGTCRTELLGLRGLHSCLPPGGGHLTIYLSLPLRR